MVMAVVLAGDVALCCSHYGCGGCAGCGCAVVAVVAVQSRLGRGCAVLAGDAALCCPPMAKLRCGCCAVAAWCGAVLALVLAGDVMASYGPVALWCCQLHAAA